MPPHDTERLRHLVALGDPDALQRLLTEAARRDDAARLYDAITAAVAAACEALAQRAPSRALDLLARLPPSEGAWRALCDLLPHMQPARLDAALSDLRAALDATWPDPLRALDSRLASPHHPALRVCRALRLHGCALPDDADRYRDALRADARDARCTSLSVAAVSVADPLRSAASLADLLRAPAFAGLTRLRVHSRALRAHLCALVRDLPQVAGLTHLGLSDSRLTSDVTEPLLRQARLRSLTHLDLSDNDLSAASLHDLLTSPHLTALTTLDLHNNHRLGPNSGGLFAHATQSPLPLTDLNLGGCGLSDDGLSALATSRRLPHLATLDLSSNSVSQAGVRALCRARSALPALHTLSLAHNLLRDSSLMALAHWPGLQGVRLLDLSQNHLQAPALSELATSRHASHLTTLGLSDNLLGDRGLSALYRAPALASLHTLDLRCCGLTDAGLLALLTSPCGPRLRALTVGNVPSTPPRPHPTPPPTPAPATLNRLTPDLALSIARLPADALPHLTHLSLALTPLGDTGAQALAASPALSSLTSLDLRGCGLSPSGALALLTSPHLTRLQHLRLRANTLGPDLARALRALPSPGPPLLDLDASPDDLTPDGLSILRASPPLHPDLCASLSLAPLPAPSLPSLP